MGGWGGWRGEERAGEKKRDRKRVALSWCRMSLPEPLTSHSGAVGIVQ